MLIDIALSGKLGMVIINKKAEREIGDQRIRN